VIARFGLMLLLAAGCGRVGFAGADGAMTDGGGVDGAVDSSATDGGGEDAPSDTITSDTSTSDTSTFDGGGTLPDSVYLEFESAQFMGESTRRAADGDLIGDANMTATAAGTWDIVLRYATLSGGVPTSEPNVAEGTLVEEPDGRFLFTIPKSGQVVLLVEISGSQWTIRVDETDPRSAGAAGFARVSVLEELTPPPNRTVGTWVLESLTDSGETIPARTCAPYSSGYAIADILFDIDPRAAFTGFQSFIGYSDSMCRTEVTRSEVRGFGFLRERAGGRIDAYVWNTDSDSGLYAWYDYELPSAGRLRLRLQSCAPDCPSAGILDFVAAGGS